MKTLLVLRHAKSSWDDISVSDHDRPLNARGKREAVAVGRHLVSADLMPDGIVSSTAKRARKTAEKVAANCGYTTQIDMTDALYEASGTQIVEVVRLLDDGHDRVLIVGHNPGLESVLELLCGASISMATASLATIELAIERWSELAATGGGRLVAHWRPGEMRTTDDGGT